MTLAKEGAIAMINMFGEEVTVRSMDNETAEDVNDPIFIDSSGSETSSSTYTVRLYTSPSSEMLEDYGFDDNTKAIMYKTEDIADVGDIVEYSPTDKKWVVDKVSTNQIGEGPYIFVYKMVGV